MKAKSSSKNKSISKKNSTSPTTGPLTVNPNTTAEIRQIQNGFVVRESWTKGTGKNQTWGSKEYYSATNPLAGSKGKVSFSKKS